MIEAILGSALGLAYAWWLGRQLDKPREWPRKTCIDTDSDTFPMEMRI